MSEKTTSSVSEFEQVQFPIIEVPFHESLVFVMVRELTQAQIFAAGGSNLSLIQTFQDMINGQKKPSLSEIVDYSETQHKIVEYALVKPTYDEIFKMMTTGVDVQRFRNEIKDLEDMLSKAPPGKQKTALRDEINELKIRTDLLLPADFLGGVMSYTLGIEKSDIRLVAEEDLYSAACKAKLGHDNPADHLNGNFTHFMRDDINNRAWGIYYERSKRNK